MGFARLGGPIPRSPLCWSRRRDSDQHGQGSGVVDQVVRQLADPRPKDSSVTRQLGEYRNLASRWTDWKQVVGVCRDVAEGMLGIEG
jgi:hypothetical protein